MKAHFILPALMLSAAIATPASANWFSNPQWGINRFIGSAPNPKPEDVRENRQPMLVRDADGNVIAMIDPATGKRTEMTPPPAPQPSSGGSNTASAAPAR